MAFLAKFRLVPQMIKFDQLPGYALPKNFSTTTKFINATSLESLSQKWPKDVAERLRKEYAGGLYLWQRLWDDEEVQKSFRSFLNNPFFKLMIKDPDKHERVFDEYILQDYLFMVKSNELFEKLIARMPQNDQDLIAYERTRLKGLLAYAQDLRKYLEEEKKMPKDKIDNATPNQGTAAYLDSLSKRALTGDHLGWLCLLVACSRGWNEAAKRMLQEPGIRTNNYFATLILWPSIHDNFSLEKYVDDGVSAVVAVTEKSPLYKLITDDYGFSVFINPRTNRVERLSPSNINDFLGDSYGSYGRKITVEIQLHLLNASDEDRPGMMQKAIRDIKEGFEIETGMFGAVVPKTP